MASTCPEFGLWYSLSARQDVSLSDHIMAKRRVSLDDYALDLRDCFTALSRDEFRILFFNDIYSTPSLGLEWLSTVLGVSPPLKDGYAGAVVNSGGVVRVAALSGALSVSKAALRRLGLYGLVHRLKRSRVVQWIDCTNKWRETLDPAVVGRLGLRYEHESDRLDLLVGIEERRSARGLRCRRYRRTQSHNRAG